MRCALVFAVAALAASVAASAPAPPVWPSSCASHGFLPGAVACATCASLLPAHVDACASCCSPALDIAGTFDTAIVRVCRAQTGGATSAWLEKNEKTLDSRVTVENACGLEPAVD